MILTLLICIAFGGALLAYISGKQSKTVALLVSGVLALLSFGSLLGFSLSVQEMQFTEQLTWFSLSGIEINWHLGVDGISYPLVLLTCLLGLVSVLISKREIHKKEPGHYALLLVLVGAIVGVFAALDLVLFFVFWEIVLVAMFLLILIWGHANRKYAAMKLLVYTGIGSLALLFAIILLGWYGGTLAIPELTQTLIPPGIQYVIFLLLLFAFFIKIPIVPFHTWLPDAHVQAPTAGSVLLAGVMLKMGAYGLLRLGGLLLSDMTAEFSFILFVLGTITVIYGAFVCLAQNHLKKLIAYSSVNHMGFVLIGIATGSSLGMIGAVFEMVSHGILSALLFGLAGVIHQRTGTYDLDNLHGLVSSMPKTAWLLVVAGLGGLGLPTMSGFIAEFLVFLASFQTFGIITIVPVAGVIITGGYFVRMITSSLFGRTKRQKISEQDINMVPFWILLFCTFLFGILPFLLIKIIRASVIA